MLGLEPGLWAVVGALVVPAAGAVAVACASWLRRRLDPVQRGHERRRSALIQIAGGLPLDEVEEGQLEGVLGGRRVALGWGRAALGVGAVPSEGLQLTVFLDAPPPGGLVLLPRPAVAGMRIPGIGVAPGVEAAGRAVLERPGVVDGLRGLAALGALELRDQRLSLHLPAPSGEPSLRDPPLESIVERMVAVARAVELRLQTPAGLGGLAAIAARLGCREGPGGRQVGTWRGRAFELVGQGEAVEVRLPLSVDLPAGFTVVGRDAPAVVRARLAATPVPVPPGAALQPWRVACAAPEAARALLEDAEVRRALGGVVDARGSRVDGDAVVRAVSPAVLGLAPERVLAPMVAAAAALEHAVWAPLEAAAGRWGLERVTDRETPGIRGRVGEVVVELDGGRQWTLRARPAAGSRVGLHLRARTPGERGGGRSGNPIVDAATVVRVEDGMALHITAAAALPLIAGRGARVEAGQLVWSGPPLPGPELQALLEEVVLLVPELAPSAAASGAGP